MGKLALAGGRPVTKDILGGAAFAPRRDLERKHLLAAHESGVWDHWPGQNSMGARFAKRWAAFNGSTYAALVTNGTHAIQLALEALDVGWGDEVIVPGLTWQATAAAVVDVNAVPVLVDVDASTLCIDPKRIAQAVTPRTRAIVAVHLYHRLADMDAVLRVARRHGLAVVEDCAHVHGSRWHRRCAGTMGAAGCFSFQMSKLLTAGEGGAILTQDEALYWRIESLRICGRESRPGVQVHSGNFRMTSLQAAVLMGQLSAFRRHAGRIDRNGLALDAAVAAAPGVRPLRRSRHITRMCGYAFAMLYDGRAFGGVSAATFRRALSAELGVAFGTTYTPLNHSELYAPHRKRRHRLSRAYVRAITPSRWHLPVAESLFRDQAVLTGWRFYGCPPRRAHLLTDAVAKLHENRDELRALDREDQR